MADKREKPVMIGARVTPKAQYGLRLLARVQGRTIAEAIEWAINLALRQTRIGGGLGETRLATLVDAIWKFESEPQRIAYLNDKAPELLDFDDRAAWNLVLRCEDLLHHLYFRPHFEHDDEFGFQPAFIPVAADDPTRDTQLDEIEFNFDLINLHWDAIKHVGTELAKAGEIEMRFSLDEILDGSALARAGIT